MGAGGRLRRSLVWPIRFVVVATAIGVCATVVGGAQPQATAFASSQAGPLPALGTVFGMTADGSGGEYVVTDAVYSDRPAAQLFHVLSDGTLDPSWRITVFTGSAMSSNDMARSRPFSLLLFGSTLYVGGGFADVIAGGSTFGRGALAAFDSQTGALTGWDPELSGSTNTAVAALAEFSGVIYAGGSFTTVDGAVARNDAAAFNPMTGAPTSWNPNANGAVLALAVNNSTIYAGGEFTTVNASITRNHLASFNLSDGTATGWNPNVTGSFVDALAITGSTIYAGGSFTSVNSFVSRASLAAFDLTAGTVGSLNVQLQGGGTGPINVEVYALAISGSNLFIGGAFARAGASSSVGRNGLASVDLNSGMVTSWNPDVAEDVSISYVGSLDASGAPVYAAGLFSSVNSGLERNNLAEFDSTGAATGWATSATPTWLDLVNAARTGSGLPAVTDHPAWASAITSHLQYLANTTPSLMTGAYASMHTENPASPYYSAAGADAASSSNLDTAVNDTDAINSWLDAPFHAANMLAPDLQQVAFARLPYRNNGIENAGLDIWHGRSGSAAVTSPIVFPGAGTSTPIRLFSGEHPEPVPPTCTFASDEQPSLPLIVLLPQQPSSDLHATISGPMGSFSTDSGGACVISKYNYDPSTDSVYGSGGTSFFQSVPAVFIVAKRPFLEGGVYHATLVNGSQTIAWSFGIDVAGASADLSITGGTTSSGGGGGGGGGGSGHLDLSVSVSASAAQVEPGADVAYVITVTDLTADPANDLTAMVSLPTGAQVVSTYSERGSGCTVVAGNATVPCDLNYLSKDSPVGRITVVVKLNTAGANVLTASAAARQVELNTANNSGSATVQVGKTAPSPTPVSAPTPTPQSSKGKTVTGSSGPNTLMGTSRNDVLNGLGGNDVLRGLDGNDVLRGGAGRDLLFGGAGNDVLYARDGERDRLDCGAGRDVAYVDKLDTVAHCEQVHRHA
jgi:hypothetical protein